MQTHDRAYYLDRERRERDLAIRCEDVAAKRAHLELAERYRAMTMDQPYAA